MRHRTERASEDRCRVRENQEDTTGSLIFRPDQGIVYHVIQIWSIETGREGKPDPPGFQYPHTHPTGWEEVNVSTFCSLTSMERLREATWKSSQPSGAGVEYFFSLFGYFQEIHLRLLAGGIVSGGQREASRGLGLLYYTRSMAMAISSQSGNFTHFMQSPHTLCGSSDFSTM